MTSLAQWMFTKTKLILLQPLGSTIGLGSIGYFSDGQWFEVGTTATMFALKLSTAAAKQRANSFDGKGGKGLRFQVRAEGESSELVPAMDAQARVEIAFGSSGSFVVSVQNQTVQRATNLAELMAAIRFAYRYRRGLPEGQRWEKKYAVVVGSASAASVAALVSQSRGASAVVVGSAALPAPTSIAELHGSMVVAASTESVDKLWSSPAHGFAVQALCIRPSIFRSWDREDIEVVKPRLSARPSSAQKIKRPRSYVHWAKTSGIVVSPAAAGRLSPSGKLLSLRKARDK